MSPRRPDPEVRTALVEAAARLLAEEGPAALSTRRIAGEVGVSTMAVYTHFGGKEDLVGAIVDEGFARFAHRLGQIRESDDPVADAAQQGIAYRANARANPHLYAVMFGAGATASDCPPGPSGAGGLATFAVLVEAVQRCIDERRWKDLRADDMATQLWASSHGMVTLELNGFLGPGAEDRALDLCVGLAVGFGDDLDLATASIRKASRRRVAA